MRLASCHKPHRPTSLARNQQSPYLHVQCGDTLRAPERSANMRTLVHELNLCRGRASVSLEIDTPTTYAGTAATY